jgi:hypothetical protein
MAETTALRKAARLLMQSIVAEGNARQRKEQVLLKTISSDEKKGEEGK